MRSSVTIMRRDEFVEIHALNFRLGELEHALERRIAEAHALIFVLNDDTEGTVEDERVEEHGVIAKFALGALRRRHIERGRQNRRLALIFHHTVRQLQPAFFSSLRDDFVLETRKQVTAGLPDLGTLL